MGSRPGDSLGLEPGEGPAGSAESRSEPEVDDSPLPSIARRASTPLGAAQGTRSYGPAVPVRTSGVATVSGRAACSREKIALPPPRPGPWAGLRHRARHAVAMVMSSPSGVWVL